MHSLDSPVSALQGIGSKRAEALARLGIKCVSDFLLHFPRDYEDRTQFYTISCAPLGQNVCFRAMVGTAPKESLIRKGLTISKLQVFDQSGSVAMTFFNRPYLKNQLVCGREYVFYGTFEEFNSKKQIQNPDFEPVERNVITGRFLPIYRKTEGITRQVIMQGVDAALSCEDEIDDPIPQELAECLGLISGKDAYRLVHKPQSPADISCARRRLIFEEFFVFSCASAMLKHKLGANPGIKLTHLDPQLFFELLPFAPTGAQKRAVSEAFFDMCSGRRMNRLLQGDVGSGKTLVAAACAWLSVKNGYQAAIMAPTEILAAQHSLSLTPIFELCGTKCALLTSNTTKKNRESILQGLETGEISIVFGTHSLIESDIRFARPALFVVDEQHRFGVAQRAALVQKAEGAHTLVMSATPIPRTLMLIMYGDLDVSIIDELPPGRQRILTYRIGEQLRQRMHGFVQKQAAQRGQVYIVCPLIDDEEGQSLKNAATQYAADLQNRYPSLKIALLHGRLKSSEKNAVMADFSAGNIDILVSTTVIEVGVNVPNATLMIVENAEQFGLSQLHQLRGRVGRGTRQSYCILVQGTENELSTRRLNALCKTSDGFLIAEEDLKLRGPGDFFGRKQHGMPEFRIADLATDIRILKEAQEAASDIILTDPDLSLPPHRGLLLRTQEIFSRLDSSSLN